METCAGGITEDEARDICLATFKALPYYDDCLALTNIDIEDSVKQCVDDIKVVSSAVSVKLKLIFILLGNN